MQRLTVLMADQTVDRLTAGGYRLLVCLAVRSAPRGEPLLWFQTGALGMSVELEWDTAHAAFTASHDAGVTVRNTYPACLGTTLVVTAATGTGRVEPGGPPGGIGVRNTTSTGFTAGLAQTGPDELMAPVCEVALFGGTQATVEPVPRAFLAMSARSRRTGRPLVSADGPGVLLDLAPEGRTVGFDLNAGWSWDGSWAEAVPAGTELAPLLAGDL
jgi:hypothetical protein